MQSTDPDSQSRQKADFERLAEFRYSLRKFLRFSEEAAVKAGLTPHQHQALLAIQGMPGRDYASVGELSERLQIKPNSAAELAVRLLQEGWIERVKDPVDSRSLRLYLTPAGLEKLAALSLVHRDELERVGPRLLKALGAAARLKTS